jgi:hypothetical protein
VVSGGEMRNVYKILDGRPKWNRPLVRPKLSSVDNIKNEWGWDGVDWTLVASVDTGP